MRDHQVNHFLNEPLLHRRKVAAIFRVNPTASPEKVIEQEIDRLGVQEDQGAPL